MTMETTVGAWAKLRQVIIGTSDHASDATALKEAFGLSDAFADPEVAELQLVDATFAISTERYLEAVGTSSPSSPMAAWLGKVGGRAGYALSVQHPDPDAVRQRCIDAGFRVAIDTVAFGKTVLQLHPKDFGLLLEVDGIDDPAVWFWDDVSPGPATGAAVDEIVGVEVPSDDPEAMARRWSDVLGLPAPSGAELDLGGAFVRFVVPGETRDWTIVLRRTRPEAVAPTLDGIEFRLVDDAAS